jgi:TRAP-type C4-dicarboxylate transport system permease large subunit
MIRIAFSLMRHTAGGPAHAAVLSSGLFGSVSGSAVGTGVVTIPMIRKRGFSANFAGGVEAAASSGGQIMPPIMGAAALVMADYVGVSYLTVVVAVLLPVMAYYASLFAMIMFESRRLGIRPDASADSVAIPTGQDYLNLILVFGPLALIVVLLVSGLSAAGASMAAIGLLLPLSFINPAVRQKPLLLVRSLANGGITFAGLLMAIAAVGIVISSLAATGVPVKFGVLLSQALGYSMLIALLVVAGGCIVLGMGMPTLPAYVTVAAIALPSMKAFGLEPLTAHRGRSLAHRHHDLHHPLRLRLQPADPDRARSRCRLHLGRLPAARGQTGLGDLSARQRPGALRQAGTGLAGGAGAHGCIGAAVRPGPLQRHCRGLAGAGPAAAAPPAPLAPTHHPGRADAGRRPLTADR